jgi:MFS family permease
VTLAWVSDRIGRKPVMLLSSAGALAALVAMANAGPDPLLLFGLLFAIHFFNNAAITLTVGPLCAETVPGALMATASGMVIASGELFGGGLAPILAGTVASVFGIEHLLWLPAVAVAVGLILSLGITETRPRLSRPSGAFA